MSRPPARAQLDVLSSRVLLRPADPVRTQAFYRDELGLAVARQYGTDEMPGLVFFLGQGLLEVTAFGPRQPSPTTTLWIQVRDVANEATRLGALGVPIVRAPQLEPWGLIEMWLADPDGVQIVLVEVPPDHPIARDYR
jgi:catechol 2,3-dioxygenase-like lactoylglutathione lyase family enzyme